MREHEYTEHDTCFKQANAQLRLLQLLFPVNEDEEKQKFLTTPGYVPHFSYMDFPRGLDALRTELAALECEDDELGKLYAGKREAFLAKIEIIKNRGNREVVLRNARELYGEVDDELNDYARKLLSQPVQEKPVEQTISSLQLKEAFAKALNELGLDDWRVELSHRFIISVIVPLKTISVPRNRFFSAKEVERLVVHEIGAHVIRAVNGGIQPYRVFSMGTPHYHATEEGVAVLSEELTDLLDAKIMRNYAALVVAIRGIREGMMFRDTFFQIKEAGFSNTKAWQISVRTHRGGGLARDHIYLGGYLQVKKLLHYDRSLLPYLYAGKIGVQHAELVRKLINDGILRDLKYVPSFLKHS